MALTNLFAGKEWRCRCRGWTCGHTRERKGKDKLRKQHGHTHTHTHIYIYILPCVK